MSSTGHHGYLPAYSPKRAVFKAFLGNLTQGQTEDMLSLEEAALIGLQRERDRLTQNIKEVKTRLQAIREGSTTVEYEVTISQKPKRRISATTRKRMSEAKRNWWARKKRREGRGAEAKAARKQRTVIPMLPATKQRGRPKKGR